MYKSKCTLCGYKSFILFLKSRIISLYKTNKLDKIYKNDNIDKYRCIK